MRKSVIPERRNKRCSLASSFAFEYYNNQPMKGSEEAHGSDKPTNFPMIQGRWGEY
jgi:hypothetical protein